jgi:hypothetical protein
MSTRTTFEERLLDGLKREIQLREAGAGGAVPAGTGEGRAKGLVRRLLAPFTPRRIAVVAAVGAAAWLAAVAVPGSPADSKAYAVERHGDGSVTLTVKDRSLSVATQLELAKEVRPWGIHVEVGVLDPGYTCKPWGKKSVLDLRAVDKRGAPEPVSAWTVTLHRGDLLSFENTKGSSRPRAITRYEIKAYEVEGDTTTCVPMKRALTDD